jgi:LPS O-antigen subunit length determinant protein (WzzB/FepE family)
MNKSNNYLADDDIDMVEIIRKLWKEKILILFISAFCMLLAYFYAFNLPKEYKTLITIKNPPSNIFDTYISIFIYKDSYNFKNLTSQNSSNSTSSINPIIFGEFIFDLNSNLLSLDNLESFLEQSKEMDNFKEFLKIKNVSAKQYFQDNKFGAVREKNQIIPNKFFLIYPIELGGDNFLNKYVEFTKKKTQIEFIYKIRTTLLNTIAQYERSLQVAQEINLESPSILQHSTNNTVLNEPDTLFYKGTKVLSQQISQFKTILTKINISEIDYDLILDKASVPSSESKSHFLYALAGLVFGFFLSLIIIFLKNILKSNN